MDNDHSWFQWFWCQIAQLHATFTNKLLRMVNAFRGTDGKLAYLSSIGWFVPSNLGSKKFLSVQMQCAHTRLNVLCIQSVGQYTIGNWFHPLRWRIICLFHRLVLHFFLGCYTFKVKLPPWFSLSFLPFVSSRREPHDPRFISPYWSLRLNSICMAHKGSITAYSRQLTQALPFMHICMRGHLKPFCCGGLKK